jgi:hypothetical protein
MWESRRFATLWASTACYRDGFTFFFTFLISLGLLHQQSKNICENTARKHCMEWSLKFLWGATLSFASQITSELMDDAVYLTH